MTDDRDIPMRPKDLGQLRTIMAADRTLMAWVRTALSMFSFGFTIYKFLQSMAEAGQIAASETPRLVGLVLAGLGMVSVIFGTLSYWATARDLQSFGRFRIWRPALVMALIMSLIGLGLFIGIADRSI